MTLAPSAESRPLEESPLGLATALKVAREQATRGRASTLASNSIIDIEDVLADPTAADLIGNAVGMIPVIGPIAQSGFAVLWGHFFGNKGQPERPEYVTPAQLRAAIQNLYTRMCQVIDQRVEQLVLDEAQYRYTELQPACNNYHTMVTVWLSHQRSLNDISDDLRTSFQIAKVKLEEALQYFRDREDYQQPLYALYLQTLVLYVGIMRDVISSGRSWGFDPVLIEGNASVKGWKRELEDALKDAQAHSAKYGTLQVEDKGYLTTRADVLVMRDVYENLFNLNIIRYPSLLVAEKPTDVLDIGRFAAIRIGPGVVCDFDHIIETWEKNTFFLVYQYNNTFKPYLGSKTIALTVLQDSAKVDELINVLDIHRVSFTVANSTGAAIGGCLRLFLRQWAVGVPVKINGQTHTFNKASAQQALDAFGNPTQGDATHWVFEVPLSFAPGNTPVTLESLPEGPLPDPSLSAFAKYMFAMDRLEVARK